MTIIIRLGQYSMNN